MGGLKGHHCGASLTENLLPIKTRVSEYQEKTLNLPDLSNFRNDINSFSCLIRRCADARALSNGINIHGGIVERGLEQDRFLGNLLVQMYGKCGSLRDARVVFDKMHDRNVFSWSLIIGSYTQCRENQEALKLFQSMLFDGLMPDRVIFVSIISVCASLELLAVGKWMHSFISTCGYASDVVLGTALVNMYGKCGSLQAARMTFKDMPMHDTISWTAIIASYAQHGLCSEAIRLYEQMQQEGMVPNRATFACILDGCAEKAAIVQGKRIHEDIADCGLESDVVVGNALISLYGKCGKLKAAQKAFKRMRYHDVVSWTALISAHAQHGKYKDALHLFQTMLLKGVTPDKVAFLIVLSACSHAGLVKQGFNLFYSMKRDYHIAPAVEHYNCMVDLLGRLGQLGESENMIKEMPVEPNATTWMTMLGACNMHLDVERGEKAAELVFKLDPENATPYVLLSNIYASAGRWDDARKTRQRMKDMGLKKEQGHSLIEVDKIVHEFIAGDTSHPQTAEIHAELQQLSSQIREAGYVPDTRAVLHDVEEEEKENMLYCHSEKLAVAFGIISTPPETSLCIIKNLRICHDCHSAIKFISKLVNRKIIVRDSIRFHLFKNGVCSCADYW